MLNTLTNAEPFFPPSAATSWSLGNQGYLLLRYSQEMQVLQYFRYCNTSGSLTPLPCRVVNHSLLVQVLDTTKG